MTSQLIDTTNEDLVIEEISIPGYEKVLKIINEKAKLKAFIAIHNSVLGPTLGGTRIYPYMHMDDALNDVLRLAKGMTYKSAVAGVGFGGAKCVIMADPCKDKTKALFHAYGEAIDTLQGKYITAEDVGCTVNDVMEIREKTKYVTGLPHEKSSGDPSRYTAWGTYRGIQSVLNKKFGSDLVKGRKIAVQGIGSVGLHLLDILFWNGAEIVIADVDAEKVNIIAKKYGAKIVSPDDILKEKCDVLAPCALGGVINDESIPLLRCKGIAGCANNQLLTDEHDTMLHEKGILYAPDFVINSGGLINVSIEVEKDGYNPIKAREKTHQIYDVLMSIYDLAEKNNIPTAKAAIELAEHRIENRIGVRTEPVYFHHCQN